MLRNLGIRSQITLIVAISFFSFLALFIYYSLQSQKLDDIENHMATSQKLSSLAKDSHQTLLRLIPVQKDFQQSPSNEQAEQFELLNHQLEASLKQLEQSASDKKIILDMEAKQAEITTSFAQLVTALQTLGYTEKLGQRGKLRGAVHAIETRLKEIKEASIGATLDASNLLTIKMLMMRRHEKDYIIRGDRNKYLGRVDKRAEEFRTILTPAPFTEETKKQLDSLLTSYVHELTLYADTKDQLSAITAIFDQTITEAGTALSSYANKASQTAQTALQDAQTARDATKTNLLIGALIALCVMTLIGFSIARQIVNALKRNIDNLKRLERGETDIEVHDTELTNEIGDLANALIIFRDNMLETQNLRDAQERQKEEADERQRAALAQLANSFETDIGSVVETVSSAVTQLQAASAQMTSTANQTSNKTQEVTYAANEASQSVQTVAAATEELSSSIHEISGQVANSTRVSERAVLIANETSHTIEELSGNVAEISNVVSLITDIAEQTNLLALNATIESARAGEAGKGFAVVASEVKTLANQTSAATEEILRQITHIQSGTTRAVEAINSISGVIQEISEISSSVASAVDQQAAATGEIAHSIEQASSGTSSVHNGISIVEQGTKDTGSAALQIENASGDLSKQAAFLHQKVSGFLDKIRQG